MHPAYNPQSGWKFISKSILHKGKPGDEVSPTGPGIRFLEEMISTYRLRHLEDEILQEDFTKGVPLGDKRKLYHRLEKQSNGDYIAVRQDGSSLKVKQPHASSNMMEAIKYHFMKQIQKAEGDKSAKASPVPASQAFEKKLSISHRISQHSSGISIKNESPMNTS
jgi:hypothetical protein